MVKAKINPIVKLLNGYPNEFKKSVRARGVDNKGKSISIDRKIYIVRAQNRAAAQKEIEDALIKIQIYNYLILIINYQYHNLKNISTYFL